MQNIWKCLYTKVWSLRKGYRRVPIRRGYPPLSGYCFDGCGMQDILSILLLFSEPVTFPTLVSYEHKLLIRSTKNAFGKYTDAQL